MITLEKLAEELNINQIDEVVAGDMWTTPNGTSGEQSWLTITTDETLKKIEGGFQNFV